MLPAQPSRPICNSFTRLSTHDLHRIKSPDFGDGSVRLRRRGRTRVIGRLGGWGYLVHPADQAQDVRPFVPTLLVLRREPRRTSDKQHV
jgi:hypothetical protein